jgi:hypothetical protein
VEGRGAIVTEERAESGAGTVDFGEGVIEVRLEGKFLG